MCMKRKGALPESEGTVPSLQMSICFDCHAIEPGLFGIRVRVHVCHPVNPGSSSGGVTTLSLR